MRKNAKFFIFTILQKIIVLERFSCVIVMPFLFVLRDELIELINFKNISLFQLTFLKLLELALLPPKNACASVCGLFILHFSIS